MVFKIFGLLGMKQRSSRKHALNLCKTQADVDLMFYFRPRPMIWLHEVTRSEFARVKPNEAVVSTKNQKREVDLLYEAEERQTIRQKLWLDSNKRNYAVNTFYTL